MADSISDCLQPPGTRLPWRALKHPSYRAFTSASGIRHEFVNLSASERVRGAMHVQNVNAYHSRLRGWLHHFRGVLPATWTITAATPEAFLCSAVSVGRIHS